MSTIVPKPYQPRSVADEFACLLYKFIHDITYSRSTTEVNQFGAHVSPHMSLITIVGLTGFLCPPSVNVFLAFLARLILPT